MLVRREDGHEIDTSLGRINLAQVQEWLTSDAYWAKGRPPEVIARSLSNSGCYGVYAPDGGQVGFARVVTDRATFAWLCDVYIAADSRGLGLGTWLVRVVRDHLFDLGVPRLMLATLDAHDLYTRVGFAPLADPGRWMEIDRRSGVPHRTGADK
jgi:GNAT superfamily N-acetyltransferase